VAGGEIRDRDRKGVRAAKNIIKIMKTKNHAYYNSAQSGVLY
jgi:hypothetical protein